LAALKTGCSGWRRSATSALQRWPSQALSAAEQANWGLDPDTPATVLHVLLDHAFPGKRSRTQQSGFFVFFEGQRASLE
jgi:hypothetical protein